MNQTSLLKSIVNKSEIFLSGSIWELDGGDASIKWGLWYDDIVQDGKRIKYIVGIDEVGRGALAGPVVIAAVVLPRNLRFSGLKDSKKLSAKQREEWFRYTKHHPQILFLFSRVYPKRIDRTGITKAANLAVTRVLKRVGNIVDTNLISSVLLDGGLNIESDLQFEGCNLRTVIRGDEKYNCIKLASIMAKVSRDRYMTRLSKRFPEYGFEIHKGYGTKAHREAVKKFGLCSIHRKLFLKKIL